jgi:hypothetical protein
VPATHSSHSDTQLTDTVCLMTSSAHMRYPYQRVGWQRAERGSPILQVKSLRGTRTDLELRLDEVRAKEMAAQAAATALRVDLEASGGAPSSTISSQTEDKKVRHPRAVMSCVKGCEALLGAAGPDKQIIARWCRHCGTLHKLSTRGSVLV